MFNLRDYKQRQQKAAGEKANKKPRYRAVICASDGSRTTGSPWADENNKQVWHQRFGSGGIGRALCKLLVPEVGLGVIVSPTDDGLGWEVVETDPFLRRGAADPRNYETISPDDLQPGGRLMLWVDSRQITPLATYETEGTLNVNITAGDYPYLGERKTFGGATNQDLSSYVPGAGLTRYAGIYLDATNTLSFVSGTTVAIGAAPPEPAWPAGAFRLSVVQLDYGQTAILLADDIFDRRMVWGDENGGGAGAWPGPGEVRIGITEYPTLADADNATVSGDLIKLGEGAFSVSAHLTLGANVNLLGSGQDVSVINLGTGINLTIPGISVIQDLSFNAIATEDVVATDTTFINVGFGDIALALTDCQVYGGHIQGGVTFAGSCLLNFPRIDGTVTGTFTGHYTNATGDIITSGLVQGDQFVSTVADGTQPLVVISTSQVANLNVDAVDDAHLDTDTTLSGNSDLLIASQKATKTYIDTIASFLKVKNTSGAAAAVNDAGYIDAVGEYKTTTTANLDAAWCVVTSGGANNADIYVARRGRVTVNYTGTAPSAGHYLVTSTVAGAAGRQTTMRPEIFAICVAAGAGGTVAALLLTGRVDRSVTSNNNLLRIVGASTSDFVATQNGAPSGANITYNAPSSGNENTIVPAATTELGKIVIHNTTRGTSAQLQAVNTGTNVMTFTDAADVSGWQSGDTLTARSQTNTGVTSSAYFYDLALDTANAEIPAMATGVYLYNQFSDTGALGQAVRFHAWATDTAGGRQVFLTQTSAATNGVVTALLPLINRRVCLQWNASGSGTFSHAAIRIFAAQVAVP